MLYGNALRQSKVSIPEHHLENHNLHRAFRQAYQNVTHSYPCFGHKDDLASRQWWELVFRQTLDFAHIRMSSGEFQLVFDQVFKVFGSKAAYDAFPDVIPFVEWARKSPRFLKVGVLSNATERYRNEILPMLGLDCVLDEFCFLSQETGKSKPDLAAFQQVLNLNSDWEPDQILHIGDNLQKDYQGARLAGIHALLLDRFDNDQLDVSPIDADAVVDDFNQVRSYLLEHQLVPDDNTDQSDEEMWPSSPR